MAGPVPKRSAERRRRNKTQTDTVRVEGVVKPPRGSSGWHPIAKAWFSSLRTSGQSTFYEPSDWQMARYIAEAMSRNLNAGKFSAELFRSVLSGMTELLTSEGARRRLRIEIERDVVGGDLAEVSVMDDYRDAIDA